MLESVDEDGRTTNPKIFAAGDAVNGGASVVQAVREADATCGPSVPEARNEAMRLARALRKPIPQIYATPAFRGVGMHFAGMLN